MRNSTILALCLGALVSVAATASYAGGPFDAATRLLERGFASVPSSTPLAYTEDFGDLQLSNCNSAWSGSVCEQDWSAFGAASSPLVHPPT